MKLFIQFSILFIITIINKNFINNKIKQIPNLENNTLKQFAYHETGHALIAHIFKQYFTINKVTIKENNYKTNGFIIFSPNNYYINYPTKKYLLANMIVTMGGYAGEIILLNLNNKKSFNYNEQQQLPILNNNMSSNSDLLHANKIAYQCIHLYGTNNKKFKNITKIERNILINYAYNKAISLLIDNEILLTKITKDLLKYNTLNSNYFHNL